MNYSEKTIQNKIIRDLKDRGYWVMKTQGGVAGTPIGTPDIIACDVNGILVAVEVKKLGGKLSSEQVHQLNRLSENYASVYVTNDANFVSHVNVSKNIAISSKAKFDSVVTYQIYRSNIYEVNL